MHSGISFLAAALALAIVTPPAARPSAQAPAAAPAAGAAAVTRADLAVAYLRFEMAYLAARLDDAETARVNRAFDALTLLFFGRQFGQAVSQLDALVASLDPKGPLGAAPGVAAFCPRLEPPVAVRGSTVSTLRIDRLYEPAAPPAALPTTVRLRPAGPASPIDLSIRAELSADGQVSVTVRNPDALKKAGPGRYDVGFLVGGRFVPASAWSVVSELPSVRKAANASRLAALAPRPELAQAVAAVAARNALLADAPDPGNTTQLLVGPEELAAAIDADVLALEKGRDPFADRRGDYWRVVQTETGTLPLRVYRPAGPPSGRPLPLVIVLHGAGGDENMFMDAYGGGLIKRLADERAFLVASPLTTGLTGPRGPAALGVLMDVVRATYAVDPDRVYLIGHSAGASAAAALARAAGRTFAAVACFNGFAWPVDAGSDGVPPIRVVSGALDPIASPARLEAAVRTAVSAGATVDYRSLPNQGHLLTVPAGLPEVVTWLLEKRREGDALPASTRPRPELARPGEREDGDITRSRR
jgi:predicted esterase